MTSFLLLLLLLLLFVSVVFGDGACDLMSTEVVQTLLDEENGDVNLWNVESGYTLLHYACICDSVDVVKMLLSDPRVHINRKDFDGRTPFGSACSGGSVNVVRYMLTVPGVDVDSVTTYGGGGRTPLIDACYGEHVEVVEALLDSPRITAGPTPISRFCETPLYSASSVGNIEIVKLLYEGIGKKSINSQTIKSSFLFSFSFNPHTHKK